ncbi:MAG: CBS domain-containing protein, partial [Myxococcales bacterium]|nr:CBS domain-containing protein [Myxococcales bacterium]
HGYSRYPVCEGGDPDRIVGYIYAKDLLTTPRGTKPRLRSLLRDPLISHESRTVGELLSEFQLTRTPLAIVVDEYGGTAGLVTLEDVVEEIVGEIQDEHDEEPPRIVRRGEGRIEVDGTLPLDELEAEEIVFPETNDADADTIGGLIVEQLGRLARRGDRVRLGGYNAQVREVRDRRVKRVLLVPRPVSQFPPRPSTAPKDPSQGPA